MGRSRESVSRILAVAPRSKDGVQRMTRGDSFVCCQGSDQEHDDLRSFCQELEALLEASGLQMSDFTPEEFTEWVMAFQERAQRP